MQLKLIVLMVLKRGLETKRQKSSGRERTRRTKTKKGVENVVSWEYCLVLVLYSYSDLRGQQV